MQDGQQENNQRQDELTRVVREGVPRPQGIKEALKLAGDKLTGRVPLGADASSKTVRKTLAASSELLAVVKFGFVGSLLVLLGALFIWAGFSGSVNWQTLGVGVVLVLLGGWCLKTAIGAFQRLQLIRKA